MSKLWLPLLLLSSLLLTARAQDAEAGEEEGPEEEGGGEVEPEGGATTEAPSTEPPPIPEDFCNEKATGMYANPEDCAAFIWCNVGRAESAWCAAGTKFDHKLGQCTFAAQAQCVGGGESGEGERRRREEDASTTTPPPTTFPVTEPPPLPDGYCKGKPTGIHPNPAECGAYISCLFGKGVATWCARGTKFDVVSGRCHHEALAVCPGEERRRRSDDVIVPIMERGVTDPPTPPTTAPDPDFCLGKEAGVYPYTGDCSFFIQCLPDGTQYITPCAYGTKFDTAAGRCTWPDKARCDA